MKKIFIYLFLLLISQFGIAQTVNISGVTTQGRFNSCGVGSPNITASLVNSTGSTVQNGNLVVTDPCGYTTLRVNISNIRWNQEPDSNWLHGLFFPENSGITISGVVLPAGWKSFPTCTGAYCSAGETGGAGFYFDANNGQWCCSGAYVNDGIPNNNYGDSNLDCGYNMSVRFDMTFCNSDVETSTLNFMLEGKADGNTGCWNSPDYMTNRINFRVNTVESVVDMYDPAPTNPETITQCSNNVLNYIAEVEGGCGNGNEITWWSAPVGGTLLGTGSPFLYDAPGNTCPQGTVIYAQCCPQGTTCDNREPVVITSPCLPPSSTPVFTPIPPQCSGGESPLPTISNDGSTGTWAPAYDPFNTTTYTFTPDPGQCATDPVQMTIDIIPTITPTFNDLDPICQNSTPPALPQPNEPGVTGTWTPAVINTGTPGIYEFTFVGDGQCVEEVTIQVEIIPELPIAVNFPLVYCQYDTPETLPTAFENGVTGLWIPAVVDTDTPGISDYTFYPDAEHCAAETTVSIEILAQPILNPLQPLELCDDDFNGIYEFNLNDLNAQLGGANFTNYYFYESPEDVTNENPIPAAQTTNYAFGSLPATIYVVGVNAAGCQTPELAVQFTARDFVPYNPGQYGPIEYCPEDTVDLTQFETSISTSGAGFRYYNNLSEAQNGLNEIVNTTEFTPAQNQTSVFVRLDLVDFCPVFAEILLERYPTPTLELSYTTYILCPGESFEVTATSDDPDATFEWTLADGTTLTGATQTISLFGTHSVVAYSIDGCISEMLTVTVTTPSVPVITNVEIGDNYVIVGAVNNGEGPMEYSLDGVFWQNDNRFNNLIPGETYTVWVRSSGCMIDQYTFTILSLPNFFSPNNDGKNDTWEIRGIENSANATLKIFDRYGKIFVDTTFEGNYMWNGRYLGNPVPSGDYWYIIQVPSDGIVAERKFVGHITVRNR